MTINNPDRITVFRRSENDPKWPPCWRKLRRTVIDLPHRAEVGHKPTNAIWKALAGLAETRSVKELAEPLTRRVPEPKGNRPGQHVHAWFESVGSARMPLSWQPSATRSG